MLLRLFTKNLNLGRVAGAVLLACVLFTVPFVSYAQEEGYRLGPGDQVRITVFGHEDLSGEFSVTGDGRISLPLIGEVVAGKQTIGELENSIVTALKPDYLVNPQVSVEVLNFRPFFIIGEVNSPGSYPYQHGMTVVNAVALAGGYTYRARKNRVLIKRASNNAEGEKSADENTIVFPGDVIRVPERFF